LVLLGLFPLWFVKQEKKAFPSRPVVNQSEAGALRIQCPERIGFSQLDFALNE
jgi:hypothetical protein